MKALMMFVALGSAAIANAADLPVKKWHPGHYTYAWGNTAEALAQPGLVGMHLRFPWRTLEPVAGQYQFGAIRAALAQAKAAGRVVSLAVEDKSWNAPSMTTARCVPDDLLTAANAEGGAAVVQTGTGGYQCTAKRWVPAVAARWDALLMALGAAFDADPALAMVQDTESAGNVFAPVAVQPLYCARLKTVAAVFARAFPTTPWAMSLNWGVQPEACRTDLVQTISTLGGGLTHPDSPPPKGVGDLFERFFTDFKGRIVSAPLQEMSFVSGSGHISQYDCGGRPCVWSDMLTNMGRMGAQFVYWNKAGWGATAPQFDFKRDMLPLLQARGFPVVRECPANIRCAGAVPPVTDGTAAALAELRAEVAAMQSRMAAAAESIAAMLGEQAAQRADLSGVRDRLNAAAAALTR